MKYLLEWALKRADIQFYKSSIKWVEIEGSCSTDTAFSIIFSSRSFKSRRGGINQFAIADQAADAVFQECLTLTMRAMGRGKTGNKQGGRGIGAGGSECLP